jgi:hypothetical protein
MPEDEIAPGLRRRLADELDGLRPASPLPSQARYSHTPAGPRLGRTRSFALGVVAGAFCLTLASALFAGTPQPPGWLAGASERVQRLEDAVEPARPSPAPSTSPERPSPAPPAAAPATFAPQPSAAPAAPEAGEKHEASPPPAATPRPTQEPDGDRRSPSPSPSPTPGDRDGDSSSGPGPSPSPVSGSGSD